MISNMKKPKVSVLTSLFNCNDYLEGYFRSVGMLEAVDSIEILLLHNAPSKEELEIIQSYLPKYPFVHHYRIDKRESLYETWNRGIKLSKGEYITIWNVDDIRLPTSICLQMQALDTHRYSDLTYGDFYYMYQYGIFSKDLVCNKDFDINPAAFFRSHQIGCFPMWRKKIHDKIGYFDEQFKLVADFDFQIRAARSCHLIKSEGILGYYLENTPGKLSSNVKLQMREKNILCLRYGIFERLNWIYLHNISKYRINQIYNYGASIVISKHFDNYRIFIIKRIPLLLISIFKQPRNFLSYIKHQLF